MKLISILGFLLLSGMPSETTGRLVGAVTDETSNTNLSDGTDIVSKSAEETDQHRKLARCHEDLPEGRYLIKKKDTNLYLTMTSDDKVQHVASSSQPGRNSRFAWDLSHDSQTYKSYKSSVTYDVARLIHRKYGKYLSMDFNKKEGRGSTAVTRANALDLNGPYPCGNSIKLEVTDHPNTASYYMKKKSGRKGAEFKNTDNNNYDLYDFIAV